MEIGSMFSSLQILTGFILILICVLFNVALTLAGSDFVSVQRRHGEREIMVRLSGISAWETATGESTGSNRIDFIYREATDGTHLVQAVYDDKYELKNCQMTDDEEKIRELLMKQQELSLAELSRRYMDVMEDDNHKNTSHHHRHHHHHEDTKETIGRTKLSHPVFTKSDLELETVHKKFQYAYNATDSLFFHYNGPVEDLPSPANTMLNIEQMKQDCLLYHQVVQDSSNHHLEEQGRSGYGKHLGPSLAPSREKRGLSFTWPGTMWCGKGTLAKSFSELGEHTFADRCCRDHDHCPLDWVILGRETKYHLFNRYFFTISHCKCDKVLHQCLKKAQTTVANEIGHTFFNRFAIQCFVFKEKQQCVEKTWWGTCTKYETVPTAVIRDGHAYPNSAKRQSREAEMSEERVLAMERKIAERAAKEAEAIERRHNKTMAKEARVLEKEEAALRKETKLAEREERRLNKTLVAEARRAEKEAVALRKEIKLAEREERRLNKTLAAEARRSRKQEAADRKEAKQAAAAERRLRKEASVLRKEIKQAEAPESRLNKTLADEARQLHKAEVAERKAAKRAAAELRQVRKEEAALRKEAKMVTRKEQERRKAIAEEEHEIEMKQAALRQTPEMVTKTTDQGHETPEMTTKPSDHGRETVEMATKPADHGRETAEMATKPADHGRETAEMATKPSDHGRETAEMATKPADHGRETAEMTTKPSDHGRETAEMATKPADHGRETAEMATKPADHGRETAEMTTKPSDHGRETAEMATKPADHGRETAEMATKPADHGRETAEMATKPADHGTVSLETAEMANRVY